MRSVCIGWVGLVVVGGLIVGPAITQAQPSNAAQSSDVSQSSDVARLAADLSERDRFILLDGLEQDSAELITTDGSANHAFWTACVAKGWMVARPPWPGGPAGMALVAFMVTPEGKAAIPLLLKSVE